MISDERFVEIRRLFFAEHWRIGTIARELGVHPDAVRRAVGSTAFNQRKAAPARASQLDAHRGFVVETLARYPHMRATRLFEMLRARGYQGSVVQLRRLVATVRSTPRAEAFLRRETRPGEEGQVDWAHFGTVSVGRARRPLVCFVLVLGWSRALYARFFLDQTTTSFLCGHVRAFEALGGVPRRLLYDNLKSAVVERVGDAVRFGEDLLALASHYHFEPRACAPYRGNEKGKVERAIQYLRHSFFTARQFADLADLNAQLDTWIAQIAHRRLAPGDAQGRTVEALLSEERTHLLPLPPSPHPVERTLQLCSGKTPYVHFDLNDYSIPHVLVGRPVLLRASEHRIRIFDDAGKLAAEHERSFGAAERIESAEHRQALERHKRHARELRGRPELLRQCPGATRFLDALVERDAPLAPAVRALLLLCDRYGGPAVDRALCDCLEQQLVSTASIERRLEEQRRARGEPPPIGAVAPPASSRFVAIDLSTYDQLAHKEPSR